MSTADFDPDEWTFLPPLIEADLPSAPPAERGEQPGVWIGSELGAVAGSDGVGAATDLGRSVFDALASAAPGLAEIARLGSIDPASLTAAGRVDALIAVRRQLAWLSSREQHLLALISTGDRSEQRWSVEEVGAALSLSGGQARARLANAEQLAARLPRTMQALSDGILTAGQAEAIVKASFVLPDDLLPAYEARLLPHAPEQSSTGLARSAQRAAHALDPATVQERTRRSIAERHVRITLAEYGTAWLTALLPAADAAAVQARIDGIARAADRDDPRSMDQLRADALVRCLVGTDDEATERAGGRLRRQPNVQVVISLDTLLGRDDQPGWLDGYGPISADYAREIAHDPTGTWQRLITDPISGQLLDYGTTRYLPPRHLAAHVVARDGECAFPFCTHRASRSDLDHVRRYPDGPTTAANLQPLHRRHHNAKTHNGWTNERNDQTGETHWTSPQGRKYTTRPPRRWKLPDEGEPPADPP